jgi:dipeptide/tripeptide permease
MTGQAKATWRFPGAFWSANVAELFERAAYYGVFIGLAVFLSDEYGFSDVGAGWVGAYYTWAIYVLPTFAGALADRMGFRRALVFAFGTLAAGYLMLGGFGTGPALELLGRSGIQVGAIVGLTVIAVGGAFVKAVISGTVAKCSDEASRARAFSIFYLMVNVGAFVGRVIAKELRVELGLQYVSYFASVTALGGMLVVLLTYRGVDTAGKGKSLRDVAQALWRVVRNGRFVALLAIVGGFWAIQGQAYSAMPKYVFRTVGKAANPEWLANINPLVVVTLVVPITHLVRRLRPITSIGIAMFIIPVSAILPALSSWIASVAGREVAFVGYAVHPVTVAVAGGIFLQALAECFLSPRFLEYASRQAPKGEEGLYMGFSHLTTAFAWPISFVLSGYLLGAYCPSEKTLSAADFAQWQRATEVGGPLPDAYANADVIWYVFTAIGIASFLLLLLYRWITDRTDARRAPPPEPG